MLAFPVWLHATKKSLGKISSVLNSLSEAAGLPPKPQNLPVEGQEEEESSSPASSTSFLHDHCGAGLAGKKDFSVKLKQRGKTLKIWETGL